MKVAMVMLDPALGKRGHRAGGAIYALRSYLEGLNPYSEHIDTQIFSFNSLYTGPVNIYITALINYQPDVIAFSTYCWNIELVKNIASTIKAILPDVTILLGGPEVSYNSEEVLGQCPHIDIIIRGEGEVTFSEVISCIYREDNFTSIDGITYKDKQGKVIYNQDRELHPNLDDFPSPFLNNFSIFAECDGEVAYESVRGCKFNCSYCLHTKGLHHVREYSMERVEAELKCILSSPHVKILWFMDPTFNADEERALKILKIVEKYRPDMPLAFELRADLLTDALIDQLGKLHVAEVGIGLQSYSEEVNKHIHRTNNVNTIEGKIRRLHKAIGKTCDQFDIDLIYGLPGDQYENYKKSVDYIIELGGRIHYQPLRVFKGTQLNDDVEKYGISYNQVAPYNILFNSTYNIPQMIKSYCLNVGIDFVNQKGIYLEIIHDMAQLSDCRYSDILETLGDYFWSNRIYDIFRVSNWSDDDRSDRTVFADFRLAVCDWLHKFGDTSLTHEIQAKIGGYIPENNTYQDSISQFGYFSLTI